MNTKHLLLASLLTIIPAAPAAAIIVAGDLGAPSLGFYKSQTNLNETLTTISLPQFTYWDNLIPYNSATGVILGMTAAGEMLIATAKHVADQSTLTWHGQMFDFVSTTTPANGKDVRITRFFPTQPLTELPTSLKILTSTMSPNGQLLSLGFGSIRLEEATSTSFYTPAPNDGTITWGLNNVGYGGTIQMGTYFNINTLHEYQMAAGDSGSPAFSIENNQWVLAAIGYGVSPTSTAYNNNSSVYVPTGTGSIFQDITLVPEPSSNLITLVSITCFLLIFRRR